MSIKLENVSKSYGRNLVLDEVSLEINDGDFATILAPTDSGKTTLLRLMAGLETPDSGKIYYDDKDVTDLPVKKRDIAMVYQDFVNYPSMTVYENIASPLRVSDNNYSEQEIDKRVRENARLLNITEILNKYPEELSGGQRQRTSIARSLAKEVDYIFLDEPLANLDYKLREELRGQLKETFNTKGETSGAIVYATADPIDALVLSTHVGYLHKGKIIQYDETQTVFNRPKNVSVAKYFSYPTINVWEAELIMKDGNNYLKVTDELKINVNKYNKKLNKNHYLLGLRTQALNLECKYEGDIEIKGEVQLREVVGSDTEIHLKYRGHTLVLLVQEIVDYNIGEIIKIYIDSSKFYIFDQDSKELIVKTGGQLDG